jgi:hypothetical protein
MKNQFNGKT